MARKEQKMGRHISLGVVAILCFVSLGLSADLEAGANDLISNPMFEAAGLPAGWTVRKPDWEKAACRVRNNPGGGILIDGGGNPYAIGGLVQEVKDIQAGKAYAVQVVCQVLNISSP